MSKGFNYDVTPEIQIVDFLDPFNFTEAVGFIYDQIPNFSTRLGVGMKQTWSDQFAATYSDGLVQGSETLPDSVLKLMKDSAKPTLNYLAGTEYVDEFSVFYDSILND